MKYICYEIFNDGAGWNKAIILGNDSAYVFDVGNDGDISASYGPCLGEMICCDEAKIEKVTWGDSDEGVCMAKKSDGKCLDNKFSLEVDEDNKCISNEVCCAKL